jgi:hypothetical protein
MEIHRRLKKRVASYGIGNEQRIAGEMILLIITPQIASPSLITLSSSLHSDDDDNDYDDDDTVV